MTDRMISKATLKRVSPNQFAYLRAIAEGLEIAESARRFLGTKPGTDPMPSHLKTMRMVTALAKHSGHPKFAKTLGKHYKPTQEVNEKYREVTFEEFMQAHPELEDFSVNECLEIYADRYPDETNPKAPLLTKMKWGDRMRQVQIRFINHLEKRQAKIEADSRQLVYFWFDEHIAKRLVGAGIVTMGDLATSVAIGKSWYKRIAGLGEKKAEKIVAMLDELLPGARERKQTAQLSTAVASLMLPTTQDDGHIDLIDRNNALIYASSDLEAVRSWLDSHTASEHTTRSFLRIARTLLLWLKLEKGGMALGDMRVEDCRAFMQFLQNIPTDWISRNKVAPGTPGWAPFRGQLTPASRQNYLDVICGLFSYLTLSRYLKANPWKLVNTRIERKKNATVRLTSKAVPHESLSKIESFIASCPDSPARNRALFVLRFMSATGLRVSELLNACVGDLQKHVDGLYAMEVVGKGSKQRVVVIPDVAITALQDYLWTRGFDALESAPKSTPLVASATSANSKVSYISLHKSLRSWITRAMRDKQMTDKEREALHSITIHWLRHTFATAAVEKAVPFNLIQAQLGHSTVQTTIDIYSKAPLVQQLHVINAAFKKPPSPVGP